MNDTDITRMAIEEIVRELEGNKLKELERQQERKVNPLGKPNKQFLGRTINSMLTHNKREDTRTRENCRRKLKQLDRRAKHSNGRQQRSTSPYKVDDSWSSSSSNTATQPSPAKKMKKKKRSHKRERSCSSRRDVKRDRNTPPHLVCDNRTTDEAEQHSYADSYEQHYYDSYNYLQSLAASTAMTMAYTQIQGQLSQYNALLEAQTQVDRAVEGRRKERSPSLTISLSSSSISLIDEADSRKILTIDVVTSDSDSCTASSSSDSEEADKKVPCISLDSDSSNHSKDGGVVNLDETDCDVDNESNRENPREGPIDLTDD